MIGEYYRPASLEEAVTLLTDAKKNLRPLGGGTNISRMKGERFSVVDLQDIGIDKIEHHERDVSVGAMVRFDSLLAHSGIHPEIKRAVQIDTSENIRNMATLGGWLITSDARSILSTLLLALDCKITWKPGGEQVSIGDWYPIRDQGMPGVLMTEVEWQIGPQFVFEYVARSPKDRPILIVAVAKWGSGRTRIALGGFGDAPVIAMDGPQSFGADVASQDAFYEAGDQWATAAYRRDVASKLAMRCLTRIDQIMESEV